MNYFFNKLDRILWQFKHTKKEQATQISTEIKISSQVSKQASKLTILCSSKSFFLRRVLNTSECIAKRVSAMLKTSKTARIWAELLLLQAKQNYGNNKEMSPDKSKQAHHKLGMTIDVSLSCQMHGCNKPVLASALLCIKSSFSSHLLYRLHYFELGLNLFCLLFLYII